MGATIPDKVTMIDNPTNNPFKNLQNYDMKYQSTGVVVSQTLNSLVVVTNSGRTVYKPKKK